MSPTSPRSSRRWRARWRRAGCWCSRRPTAPFARGQLLVEAAERLGMVPRGTHHWSDFVTPEELRDLLTAAGLQVAEPRGISWSPLRGLHLSSDVSLNYILSASRRA